MLRWGGGFCLTPGWYTGMVLAAGWRVGNHLECRLDRASLRVGNHLGCRLDRASLRSWSLNWGNPNRNRRRLKVPLFFLTVTVKILWSVFLYNTSGLVSRKVEWTLSKQEIGSVHGLFRTSSMRPHHVDSCLSSRSCHHHLKIWSPTVSELGSTSAPVP